MSSQSKNQNIVFQIVIKRINDYKASILIETDSNNECITYSKSINKKELLNEDKSEINLEDCLNNKKFVILKKDDNELIIELKESKKKLIFERIMFYILWRDSNYIKPGKKNEENPYYYDLVEWEDFCFKNNIFAYFVNSTEDALKFLKNRISNNIIFITNIAKNLPGKRYIEIIRKIYGFKIIVLFFSSNNTEHYKWIKNFENCLYDWDGNFVKEYILKYSKENLKELRNKNMKSIYGLELKEFSDDFFNYSKINNKLNVPNIEFKIYNENIDKYLYMSKEGEVKCINDNEKDCKWDIIFFDNTVTFYSKGFYLKDEEGNIKGDIYTFIWNYEKINNQYHFKNPYTKKILAIDDNKLNTCNSNANKNINFQLKDLEKFQIFPNHREESRSNLSDNIFNLTDSLSIISLNS